MRFKPAIWYPISAILSLVNLVAVAFAVMPGEPWWHATGHAALAVGFGLWAQRLRQKRGQGELPAAMETREALEALDGEVSRLRQELSEAQERLDFTERLLAQRVEARQSGSGLGGSPP